MNETLIPHVQPRVVVPAHGELVEPRLVPPSTDAERADFVKDLARSAVAMFPNGILHGAQGGPIPRIDYVPTLGSLPTARDFDASVPLKQGDVVRAPRVTTNDERPTKTATPDRWYQVSLWVCGTLDKVPCQVPLTPRELMLAIQRDGLTIEEADGSVEWVDPASLSRIRVDVMPDKPRGHIRRVSLKRITRKEERS